LLLSSLMLLSVLLLEKNRLENQINALTVKNANLKRENDGLASHLANLAEENRVMKVNLKRFGDDLERQVTRVEEATSWQAQFDRAVNRLRESQNHQFQSISNLANRTDEIADRIDQTAPPSVQSEVANSTILRRLRELRLDCEAVGHQCAARSKRCSYQTHKLNSFKLLALNRARSVEKSDENRNETTGQTSSAASVRLADFASVHCGATVAQESSTFSEIPIWNLWRRRILTSSSAMSLNPQMNPGECWPCVPPCFLRVKLCNAARVKSFSIRHIPASLSPSPYGQRDTTNAIRGV